MVLREYKIALVVDFSHPASGLVTTCALCGSKDMEGLGAHANLCPKLQGHRTAYAGLQQRPLRGALRAAGAELYPGEPPMDVFMERKPGGDPAQQQKAIRCDIGFTLSGQNLVTLVDLTHCATSAASRATAYKNAGDAASKAENNKECFYKRTFQHGANLPPCEVRGFAQETGGPLGAYAKLLLHSCATLAPQWGLPGRNNIGGRYRRLTERFSVLNQRYVAATQRHYRVMCLRLASAQPPIAEVESEGDSDSGASEEGGRG